jgi:nucleotidyltransferase/DNA polymerase involved in DNA repair
MRTDIKTPIALVDCNCFYVSYERVFNPALKGKPILARGGTVVLSSNY